MTTATVISIPLDLLAGKAEAPPQGSPFEAEQAVAELHLTETVAGYLDWWRRYTNRWLRAEYAEGFREWEASKARKTRKPKLRQRYTNKATGDFLAEPEYWTAARQQFDADLWVEAQSLIRDGALQAQALGLPISFDLVNDTVLAYSRTFMNDWWSALATTTRTQMQTAISGWIQSGAPLSNLTKQLTPLFGRARANVIAATETTRMYADGNTIGYSAAGVTMVEWRTSRDERVCQICLPLHGDKFAIGTERPPAHVSCRCSIVPVTAQGKVLDKRVDDPLLTGDVTNIKRFQGGAGKTSTETFRGKVGGKDVFLKPKWGLPKYPLRQYISAGSELQREAAAYLVNQRMGNLVPMPRTVLRDLALGGSRGAKVAQTAVSEFVDGTVTMYEAIGGNINTMKAARQELVRLIGEDGTRRLAIYDAVIGNADRHAGNMLYRQATREWFAIDHGLAFPEAAMTRGNTWVNDAAGLLQGAARQLGKVERDGLTALLADGQAVTAELVPLIGQEATNQMWNRVIYMLKEGTVPDGDVMLAWYSNRVVLIRGQEVNVNALLGKPVANAGPADWAKLAGGL